jgi:ERCC4-type nuclease
MTTLPAKLDPSKLTAIIDSAEQTPFDLSPMRMEVGSLQTGDYSVKSLERYVTVERKAWGDFLSCVGKQRKRFDKCVERMRGFEVKAIVIEGTWDMVYAGEWERDLNVLQVASAIHGWICRGIPVIMAGTHALAAAHTRRILTIAAQRRWRENLHLIQAVEP